MYIKPSPYKRNGRWYARVAYTDNKGKHHTPSLKAGHSFKTKKEVWEYSDLHKNEVINRFPNIKKDISLIDYYYRWAVAYKLPGARSRTKNRYQSRIPNSIKTYFKDTPIRDITRLDYQNFINWFGLKDKGGHVRDTVVKLNNAVVHCAKLALSEGLISRDFTANVQVKYNPKKKKVVEYLSFEEFKKVKATTIEKLNPLFTGRYMILTIMYTGMRKEEIQALTWGDIGFEANTININKAYNDAERRLEPTTKTKGSNRVISVSPELLKYLKQLKSNGTHYIFQNPWGGRTIPSSDALGKLVKKILSDSGLKKRNFTFYSFRHVFISIMIANQVELYPLSKYAGNSVQSIQQHYAYEIEEYRKKQNNRIAKLTQTF